VNPSSGGNRASMLTNIGTNYLQFRERGFVCDVFIYDLTKGDSGKKPGFKHLGETIKKTPNLSPTNPIRLIVGGGDGTVMWALKEALAHGIDIDKVAFGIIPFGSGNDFSRATYWGFSPPDRGIFKHEMAGFKALILQWFLAKIEDFDVWEVTVKVNDHFGHITQIKDKKPKNIHEDTKTLTSLMANYYSIGVESRIGFGFDKRRTRSKFLNKSVYAMEFLRKTVKRTAKIRDVVDSVVVRDRVIFSTSSAAFPQLIGDPVSLLFLNIPSFAAGTNPWGESGKLAIRNADPYLMTYRQCFGDGELEILSFESRRGLAFEQAKGTFLSGNAARVAQEAGPIQVNFRQENLGIRTYMQVDGEYYRFDNPQYTYIRPYETIRVLTINLR
jgi:diacylglycerol kinase (ATP)